MIPFFISAALFLSLVSAIIWYGYRVYSRPAKAMEQLAAPVSGLPGSLDSSPSRGLVDQGFHVTHLLQWVGEQVPADPLTSSFTRRQLMAAGYRSEASLPIFLGLRLLATFATGLAALLAIRFTHLHPLLELGLVAVAALLGHMLSNLVLDLLGDRYKDILRASLPDALDLLIVAVEAGLALDQALRKVSEDLALTHPEISREFSLVSLETRTGVKRADALRNMAERTMEPEIRKFVAIMVQTDKFGTSIADSLRAHSEFMRVRRRQIAEEKANKLGVKLTIVVFFFILPAILIISGGPAFLRIFKELLPALRSIGGR